MFCCRLRAEGGLALTRAFQRFRVSGRPAVAATYILIGMTERERIDENPEDPQDSDERFKKLPPIVPVSGVVAFQSVEELPYGGPEGGGVEAGDGD